MSVEALKAQIPEAKWKSWEALPKPEVALLSGAYLCDYRKPREDRGRNRGTIVDLLIKAAGYNPKDSPSWCAITVAACCLMAGYSRADIPRENGRVYAWREWAKKNGRLRDIPKRGRLCYWLNESTRLGHIGIVVKVVGPWVYSIEGNTGPEDKGDQREGDGCYRRIRLRKTWDGYIELP